MKRTNTDKSKNLDNKIDTESTDVLKNLDDSTPSLFLLESIDHFKKYYIKKQKKLELYLDKE